MKNQITRFLRRTLFETLPTMAGIIVISFFLLKMVPGDAVDAIVGASGSSSEEMANELRELYGLNDTIVAQLGRYFFGVITLDLGISSNYGAPVFDVIMQRLPNTIILMLLAFCIAFVSGVGIGWIMSAFAGRLPDRLLTAVTLFLYSAPSFWIGLMSIVLFSVWLRWLPSGGAQTLGVPLTGWADVVDRARHLVLPAAALASFYLAIYARLTRATMLEVLRQDYIRTAAAKGLHPAVLQLRHGLRNALIPVTTVAGLHLGNLLGGAIVVESVFNWPGVGRLMMDSLSARDVNVLLGILLLTSAIVILSNILIDWIVTLLDPRIKA